jgi:hypothetical protein
MSSALALAAVTSILKDLLDNRLIQRGVTDSVGDVTVTAITPDRVPVGAEERNQLNLFLYRVTPHTKWRRSEPSSGGNDETNGHRPLELDLHYLLTAYGEHDFQSEILLGYAVQLLHETPTLSREAIRSGLGSASRNGSSSARHVARSAVSTATLAEQVEEITIVPEFLSMEESSKLWSTLQARYRPSVAFEVSAVVIEPFK